MMVSNYTPNCQISFEIKSSRVNSSAKVAPSITSSGKERKQIEDLAKRFPAAYVKLYVPIQCRNIKARKQTFTLNASYYSAINCNAARRFRVVQQSHE